VERQGILVDIWRFFRVVLIIVLIILAGVAASYLIWGPFTLRAYSTRLFWAGIGAAVLGALAIVATLGSYSTMGVSNILTASADAPIATERIREYMQMNAKRYGFTFRMAAVGIICMGLSALIEILSR
jgi:hypothetical protein